MKYVEERSKINAIIFSNELHLSLPTTITINGRGNFQSYDMLAWNLPSFLTASIAQRFISLLYHHLKNILMVSTVSHLKL